MRIRKSISLGEKSLLENLKGYKIIRTKSSKVFDELAAFTANLFNTPIAVIDFVDPLNIWNKKGEPLKKIASLRPGTSVCSLAIANESVADFKGLVNAPALITNALIAAELGMCFYAAVPIINKAGVRLGTVCIADKQQRDFLAEEREKLEWVAHIVQKEMDKKIAQKLYA